MTETRSKPNIKLVSDLEDAKVVSDLFSWHLGKKVTLTLIEPKNAKDAILEHKSFNDFYGSKIFTAHYKLKDDEDENEFEFEVVIKNELDTNWHTIMGKILKLYTKENFWYSKGLKAFPQVS